MEGLRTQNEQLRRINQRIDTLIEDIREELLARTDTSLELSDGKVRNLLRYIANPLRNLSIDGDQDMLADKVDLYEKVISELQAIMEEGQYSDGRALTPSEVKTFEKARDLIKTDKENGIDIISQVYEEIIDEKRGNLEETFVRDKVEADDRMQDIRRKIQPLEQELLTTLEPAMSTDLGILNTLGPELSKFNKQQAAIKRVEELEAEIDDLNTKIGDRRTSQEEKEEFKKQRNNLYNKQISAIKASDPQEYSKPAYERQEQMVNGQPKLEKKSDYVARLISGLTVSAELNRNALVGKMNLVFDAKMKVLEVDPSTGDRTVKEVEVGQHYLPTKSKGDDFSETEIAEFAEKFQKDLEELRDFVSEKRTEKSELESERAELSETLATDMRTASLAKVPYLERADGQTLSAFEKWRQRMSFRMQNAGYWFKGKEAVEKAMVQKKIDAATLKINKKELLKDVEEQQRKFKDKLQVKTKVKSNVFKNWDEEIDRARNGGSGR